LNDDLQYGMTCRGQQPKSYILICFAKRAACILWAVRTAELYAEVFWNELCSYRNWKIACYLL